LGVPPDYTDARPLQVRVADEIRTQIEAQQLAPGAQLPTLDDLATSYLCSLTVIRAAVSLLKHQGLVVSRQGKGNFVRERPAGRRHEIERYSKARWRDGGKPVLVAEAEQQGHTVGQFIRELTEVPAPVNVAERLRVKPGTAVWVRRWTTVIDGRPNQLADSYYELDVARDTLIQQENIGPGGGFARLEEAGYDLIEMAEELSARMPTGPESIALKLPEGTPVVDLIRTTYDSTGRPLEVMLAVIASDMITFNYRFPIPD
jgi:GntR family transcriptional regulator